MKKILIVLLCLLLTGCTSNKSDDNTPTITETPEVTDVPVESEDPVISVDLTSPDSINVLVNKTHPLPEDYEPDDLVIIDVPATKEIYLRQILEEDLLALFEAAAADGVTGLNIVSGYRSYSYQANLFKNYSNKHGEEAANRFSARPGQSEHQLGLAIDFGSKDGSCNLSKCYKDTEEGIWLYENAYKYGFIIRYLEETEDITGYIYEPWHYRYVGAEEAQKITESGLTYEEYYGILD